MPEPKKIAVVLAGAVAKGAFEAGALAELVKREDVHIQHIVAASSGALNGTVLAASIHGAQSHTDLVKRVEALCDLWIEKGDLSHAFHPNALGLVRGTGISDQSKLRTLLTGHLRPSERGAAGANVTLKIVISPIQGVSAKEDTSTFEAMREFQNADFETEEGLSKIYDVAVASASFPLAFAPSQVDGLGPCIDGGTVNNSPIKYAVQNAPGIDSVIVIAPTPADATIGVEKAGDFGGLGLIGRLADMLINERLHRDLKEADETNEALRNLEEAVLLCLEDDETGEIKQPVQLRKVMPLTVSA